MDNAKTPTPMLRVIFVAAFLVVIGMHGWAGYVRTIQHPAPPWTAYLPEVLTGLVFGFFVLLYPMSRMSPSFRRILLAIFFGMSALELFLFVKG
jgi:hypothetical protein